MAGRLAGSRRQPVFGRLSASGEKWPALTAAGGLACRCDSAGSGAGATADRGCCGQQPEISSFRLYLAAEGKAAKTVRTYVEAVRWFAAAHLLREAGRTGWEQAGKHDVQQWMVWLLGR